MLLLNAAQLNRRVAEGLGLLPLGKALRLFPQVLLRIGQRSTHPLLEENDAWIHAMSSFFDAIEDRSKEHPISSRKRNDGE